MKVKRTRGERKRRRGKKTTRCSVFPLANAPSQLVKLHPAYLPFSPVPIFLPFSPSLSLSLSLSPSSLSLSLSLVFSLTLLNLWSTPDLESYLYDICVHYLAQGVQGTGISSRNEPCCYMERRRKRRRECLLYLRARN